MFHGVASSCLFTPVRSVVHGAKKHSRHAGLCCSSLREGGRKGLVFLGPNKVGLMKDPGAPGKRLQWGKQQPSVRWLNAKTFFGHHR